jgi:hypothetical protein
MSEETPKFQVIDRRKARMESAGAATAEGSPAAETGPAPEAAPPAAPPSPASVPPASGPRLVTPEGEIAATSPEDEALPAPTAEQAERSRQAYSSTSERLNDLIRASDPGAEMPETVNFETLVQQLYLSAMLQLGEGTPQGERAPVDIIGARQSIDLLGVLAEKTRGNLNDKEQRLLDSALFELRMAFLEIVNALSRQPIPPPPGKCGK